VLQIISRQFLSQYQDTGAVWASKLCNWSVVAFKDKKLPDDELRFETYVGVQTFYKSYNKKWILIVHQLVWYNLFSKDTLC
jgi:hypothetical protein